MAKIIKTTGAYSSSYIPVKIEGYKTNLILDDKGTFVNDKEIISILEKYKDGYVQPKQERYKKSYSKASK